MVDNGFICIIKEGVYRHPIYYCQGGGQPQLIQYCPINELSEVLNAYSNTYQTNKVYLDGIPAFMYGIKEQIQYETLNKYGYNNLDIEVIRKD